MVVLVSVAFDGASMGFSSSHCCAKNPTKNRNQSVMSLVRMVAVALIPAAASCPNVGVKSKV